MMTLSDCYEKEADSLLRELDARASSPEQVIRLLEKIPDRMLLEWNSCCESEAQRRSASGMMAVLRMSLRFLDCRTTVLFSGTSPHSDTPVHDKKNRDRLFSYLFLGLGSVCILASFMSFLTLSGEPASVLRILAGLVIGVLGGAALYYSGRKSAAAKGAPGRNALYDQGKIDSQKVCHALRAVFVVMDQELADVLQEERRREAAAASGACVGQRQGDPTDVLLSGEGLTLMADLLEALYSEDGAFALERLSQVVHFLQRNGIELPAPDPKKPEYYDRMPGKQERLVRPAMVQDGRILKKGLITG